MVKPERKLSVDHEALTRALALVRADADPLRREQIEGMLKGDKELGLPARSWFECAHFAAYHAQVNALGLKPWQSPPMFARDEGLVLLKRMLAAGLSKFEPDPVAALGKIAQDV